MLTAPTGTSFGGMLLTLQVHVFLLVIVLVSKTIPSDFHCLGSWEVLPSNTGAVVSANTLESNAATGTAQPAII